MMRRLLALFALVSGLLAALPPALAVEEITAFAARVVLSADGSVDVTETIDIRAEGDRIRRGITRDVFTVLRNDDGSRLRSSLDVVSVMRDGTPEPWSLEAINNGQRIRIGDPDVLLPRGEHRYVIRYTMTRMARRFADHDELFWNVTGNFWDFAIRDAVATIVLPEGARVERMIGYTGPMGSLEQAVTTIRVSDREAVFRATRALRPGEGLSVAIAFPHGVLVEPNATQGAVNYLSDHREIILPAVAVGLVLLFFTLSWNAVGRDPPRGTIIPLFHPPKGLSPALVHYVHNMGWRNSGWTAFTAAIFDLAVKGLATIASAGKTLTIAATGKEVSELPRGERVLLGYLQASDSVTIDKTTGPALNSKRAQFISALENENRLAYFNNNRVYSIMGAALSLLCLGGLVLGGVLEPLWLGIATIVGIVLAILLSAIGNIWRSGSWFARLFFLVWVGIFSANGVGAVTSMVTEFRIDTPVIAAASIVLINLLFLLLLRAPTVPGRKVMDEIEGFRLYLDTAEKNRLNMVGEPRMTVQRFEAILPYAIALGVEKPWSEHFEGELARNAVAGATASSYSPGWYSGSGGNFSASTLAGSIGATAGSMSAAMAAAQPSSSSGSGFSGGGGGGSGGGGGGGGGGGW